MSEPSVTLIHFPPNYMDIIAGAMSKCYDKKVGHKAVVKHAVEAGHLSVLEHVSCTFDIECSLAVLGQFTRHRHISPTVKSTRGADFECEYIIPEAFKGTDWEDAYVANVTLALMLYKEMVAEGVKHEDAAYVLPKGTLTKLRVTANLRTWFEYLPKRQCKRAMPEHRVLAALLHGELAEAMPEVFLREFMNCKNCTEHGCEFH